MSSVSVVDYFFFSCLIRKDSPVTRKKWIALVRIAMSWRKTMKPVLIYGLPRNFWREAQTIPFVLHSLRSINNALRLFFFSSSHNSITNNRLFISNRMQWKRRISNLKKSIPNILVPSMKTKCRPKRVDNIEWVTLRRWRITFTFFKVYTILQKYPCELLDTCKPRNTLATLLIYDF